MCVLCALTGDWYCFASILLGMVASGIACLVIGSGKLRFEHPLPAKGAPRGDGVLDDGDHFVVLLGEEAAVNSLTRGRFTLDFDGENGGQKYSTMIGLCSILLTVQFLAQLLLIPQGTLFGQLMFVTSLAVSWGYNAYLASLDREDRQTDILMRLMRLNKANFRKFALSARTARVVLACLAMTAKHPMRDPRKLLDKLIPNDTEVWLRWKIWVTGMLSRSYIQADWEVDLDGAGKWLLEDLEEDEQVLLLELLKHARKAYQAWVHPSGTPSRASSPASEVGSDAPLLQH
ncbi:hypothetical protein C8Q76DRAFT_747638 [Earliella scabrosa]|nr:hypothetical protein C8Q76DRAFT_747638 [Earliella scabrosa]